jgi:hypothetical protein
MLVAEADGNRTRQTEILGLTGFEDRGAHQDSDASTKNPTVPGEDPTPQIRSHTRRPLLRDGDHRVRDGAS